MTEPSFGVMLFTHRFPGQDDADVLRLALDIARRAEELGFDDVWTTEHHFISYGVNPSALAFAAFLLGGTRRMRVGTAVTILPSHPPTFVAEQAAMLDHVSGGRFDLGVGRGGPVVDYEVLGRSLDHWRSGMPEALDLLMASFAGPVSADSDLNRFRQVTPGPRPLTRPHPPVYVAATSDHNADLAARHQLPMLFFLHQDASAIQPLVERHATGTGRTAESFQHGTAMLTHVTETEQEARALVRDTVIPFFEKAHSEYVMLEERVGSEPPPSAMEEMFLRLQAIGPVELCAQRIADRLRVPGVRRAILHVESAGEPQAVLANLERVATSVLPLVRKMLAD